MPRKTKDQNELEKKKTSVTKKAATKKATSTKKVAAKTTKTQKTTTQKTATEKTKKAASKKKTETKKAATKSKSTTKKATKKVKKQPVEVVEYYDLPYRYNQTIVKLLAQTPTTLFIYWDISDKDRKNFQEKYGEDFFEVTKPVLIVYNDTLNYHFEVEINDFANSWYLHVADSKCDYRIELGRRPIVKNEKINIEYIPVTYSNEIESPNDKILFNKEQKMVYFRDVKTGITTSKPIQTISFMRSMGKIYDIYDFYKTIYQSDNLEDLYDLSNPSS